MSYDYIAKLVLIGDSGCGKSSLMHRLTDQRFQEAHDVTLGSDFGSSIIKLGEKAMKLQLWDTAGQETYKSVTRSYFRGSSGALLTYDISRRQTFEHIKDWLADLRAAAGDNVCIILVANKSDLEEQREVAADEARMWAKANGITEFIETSARTGSNVNEAFRRVAAEILQRIQTGKFDVNDKLYGVRAHDNKRQKGIINMISSSTDHRGSRCC